MNKQGKVSRCTICDSKMHWFRSCPHKSEHKETDKDKPNGEDVKLLNNDISDEEEYEDVKLTLLTEKLDEHSVFVAEMGTSAVIDTACSRTVAGRNWLLSYMKNLDDTALNEIEMKPSRTAFKFGDGHKVYSEMNAIIPVEIGEKPCDLDVEIVDENIPLLLSKSTLKNAETILDLHKDAVQMFGKNIPMHLSSSGHYAIDIIPKKMYNFGNTEQCLVLDHCKSEKEKKNAMKKIHKQFGHASTGNLSRLFKSANSFNEEIASLIKETVDTCKTCKVYRKPKHRPVVGLSRATDFNHTVAMDLHSLDKNTWYFHMIDEFTRYSSAAIIHSKSTSLIVKKFLQNWISIFGCPKQVFSDNGGEFVSHEFMDMCESFNIDVITTAAYSPWSNGVCERHNAILTNMIIKVKEDEFCDWETALAWSLNAKNSLININGFSASQLVFGRNPSLPSVLCNKLPADLTETKTVSEHLTCLHSARRAFVASESSEKIRRALRRQTRDTRETFDIGREVYYKRNDDAKWKGPGKVAGQDGAVVLIRHGGFDVKVHCTRVQYTEEEEQITDNDAINEAKGMEPDKRSLSDKPGDKVNKPSDVIDDDSDDELIQFAANSLSASSNDQETLDENNNSNSLSVQRQTSAKEQGTSKPTLNISQLKKGQLVSFNLNGETHEVRILGRAGKATGTYKNSYNVKYVQPEHMNSETGHVDLDKVDSVEVQYEETEEILEVSGLDFKEAKVKELESWKENMVYEEVPNKGQPTISLRWVCSIKDENGVMTSKARLVAKGYEDPEKNDVSKDSPTCSREALRVLMALTAQRDWNLNSIDIKTAFLQGHGIGRDIYVVPPKEANTDSIWKLEKCVYGLVDASRKWYDRVKIVLLSANMKMCKTDPAVFYFYENNRFEGMIAIHVDDFLWAGSMNFEKKVIDKLRETFKIGKECNTAFRYLGIDIQKLSDGIIVDQTKYIRNAKLHKSAERNNKSFKSSVGKLLWISGQTRPDISFDTCQLGNKVKNPTDSDFSYANKVLKHVQTSDLQLTFKNLGDDKNLKIVVFVDASFANLMDGGSQEGFLIFLVGEDDKCSLLHWQSSRIRRVVRSSLAAETLALSDSVDNEMFLSYMISEVYFGGKKRIPIEVYTDNRSLRDAIYSSMNITEKRLRVEIAMLREMVESKQLHKVHWIVYIVRTCPKMFFFALNPQKRFLSLALGPL